MSKMKEIMMQGMNKVMLDCDHATMAIIRADLEKTGCLRKMQLHMHLMGCKFCREFARQSRSINRELAQFRNIDAEKLQLRLDDRQKDRIAQAIEQNR